MPHQLDDTDLAIIRQLQENARRTNQEIANSIGLAPSTLTRRLQWLEEKKRVIQGYTCVIDPAVMDYKTLGYTLIRFSKASKTQIDKVIDKLKNVPEVSEISKILGGEDLIVKLHAHDNEHYQRILEAIGPSDNEEGYHTTTLLVTQQVYSGGMADVVRKAAEQAVGDKAT